MRQTNCGPGDSHVSAERLCPACGAVFCKSCCTSHGASNNGDEPDWMACPACGYVYIIEEEEGGFDETPQLDEDENLRDPEIDLEDDNYIVEEDVVDEDVFIVDEEDELFLPEDDDLDELDFSDGDDDYDR